MAECYYGCGLTDEDPDDLRPYGPEGALVCFSCAQATPERAAASDAIMNAHLDKVFDQAHASGENRIIFGGGMPRTPSGN